MGAMKNLLIRIEENIQNGTGLAGLSGHEKELARQYMANREPTEVDYIVTGLAQAVGDYLAFGFSEEQLNQAVLETVQKFRLLKEIETTNPVLTEPDFDKRCREWEEKNNAKG